MVDVASAVPLMPGANGAHRGDAVEQLPEMAVDGKLVLQHVKLEESVAVVSTGADAQTLGMPAIPAALPPKKRQRGRPRKVPASLTSAAEAATATEGALGNEPLTPLQTPKVPARKRAAAAGGKRAAKGQTKRAASTASAAVVPCSDEAPELVDVKQELPDVKVEAPSPEVARAAKRPKHRHTVAEIAEDYVPRELPDPAMLQPLPVPNLGYCCLNVTLRNQKPQVFCNRDCILKTFTERGLDYIGEMALQNCRDLEPILWWNYEHGVRLFRLSSNFFPWGGKYKIEDLPTYEGIKAALARAGQVARATGQRLTAHPSEFVKLAAPRPELVEESLGDLELHGSVFDLMGYEPSHWNKINIHVGGAYGDKQAAMERFAASWQRLSPGMKKRLTVENDDRASMFSVSDLLWLHEKVGIPIVFDFHHYQFCTGALSQEEALRAAVATWPADVRPIVHWSESPPEELGKKPHAHSDYVGQHGPMVLYGLERDVDVMIEAKAKELALLQYRDVALNGPLLAQIGRDGNTYAGRARSGMLEGCEMIFTGDKRLHSRGHKKPAVVKKEPGAEDAEDDGTEVKPKPKAARKKKVKVEADAADGAEGAVEEQAPKPKKAAAPRRKKADAAQAAGENGAAAPEQQAPKPKAAPRRKKAEAAQAAGENGAAVPEPVLKSKAAPRGKKAVVPKTDGEEVKPAPKRKAAASRVKKEPAAV